MKTRKILTTSTTAEADNIDGADQDVPSTTATDAAVAAISSPKPPSKQAQLAALLVRDEGATLDQMIVVTSWLPHTTRAALTGLKKKGYVLSSDKIDGMRTYRGIAPQ